MTSNHVVVAMSGGVDSSVSALLLAEQGYHCVGVSMQVWDYRNNGGSCTKATCCAPDDFTDARKVAARIGMPYYVFDFEKSFRASVIDVFIDTYKRGETPNPCVECNNKVKFRALRERALSFGYPYVATGHYAQIERRGEQLHLIRGRDSEKDQSYFLYGLRYDELATTLFPVGHLTKPEVRELARVAGLSTAAKPESQDICFVSGSVQDFLVRIGGKKPPGRIVKRSGEVVGYHEGITNFTVGQRKGLHIGGLDVPLYVLEIDAETDTVFVGTKEELETQSFFVREMNWIAPDVRAALADGVREFRFTAQLRHRHRGVPVSVTVSEDSATVKAQFLGEWTTVSPGQAAVLYCNDNREVVGGGKITSPGVVHRVARAYEKPIQDLVAEDLSLASGLSSSPGQTAPETY